MFNAQPSLFLDSAYACMCDVVPPWRQSSTSSTQKTNIWGRTSLKPHNLFSFPSFLIFLHLSRNTFPFLLLHHSATQKPVSFHFASLQLVNILSGSGGGKGRWRRERRGPGGAVLRDVKWLPVTKHKKWWGGKGDGVKRLIMCLVYPSFLPRWLGFVLLHQRAKMCDLFASCCWRGIKKRQVIVYVRYWVSSFLRDLASFHFIRWIRRRKYLLPAPDDKMLWGEKDVECYCVECPSSSTRLLSTSSEAWSDRGVCFLLPMTKCVVEGKKALSVVVSTVLLPSLGLTSSAFWRD